MNVLVYSHNKIKRMYKRKKIKPLEKPFKGQLPLLHHFHFFASFVLLSAALVGGWLSNSTLFSLAPLTNLKEF